MSPARTQVPSEHLDVAGEWVGAVRDDVVRDCGARRIHVVPRLRRRPRPRHRPAADPVRRCDSAATTDGDPRGTCMAMLHLVLALPLIQFLGQAEIPGDASDGTTGAPVVLEDGSPMDRLGGFGSALSYTGIGSLFIATPDRGPADGTTRWIDRAYLLEIAVELGERPSLAMSLVEARPLVDEEQRPFLGLSSAFDPAGSPSSARLDPEGVRASARGTFYVSDEYGPQVYEFDAAGRRIGAVTVPESFLVLHPGSTLDEELPPNNVTGRQPNRGMEGLAISPDGETLFGIMQSPLIQDHGLDAQNKRKGLYIRILAMDVTGAATREYVYPLDSAKHGVSEILAVDDQRFLVLERDGDAGTDAKFKRLFLIDLAPASDVSGVASLPQTGPLPSGVVAVTKTPFLDLLDPAYGLAGAAFPEKIEGLAWGPDLPDGRHLLLVTSDNDLHPARPSIAYGFAIAPSALPGLEPQILAPEVIIQPGDRHHRVWPTLRLPVTISVLSHGLLDATAVAPRSLRLAGAPVLRLFGIPLCAVWDVERDGDADLTCVMSGDLALSPRDSQAVVEARTTTGTPVRSYGAVSVR